MNKIAKYMTIAIALTLFPAIANAGVFIKFDNISSDSTSTNGWKGGNWFVADSFSFGVEREMKESGEKAGTEDINIGIGELQEVSISRSMDAASAKLAQYSINGNSLGNVEVCVTDNPDGPTGCYLYYKLERCFVKSWSVSGDADDRPTEEVAFYYNRIAFSYAGDTVDTVSWDKTINQPWSAGELSLSDQK